MKKITPTRSILVNGAHAPTGSTVETDADIAAELIASGAAVEVMEQPARAAKKPKAKKKASGK